MDIVGELRALWHEVKLLKRRATVGGGGVPPSIHVENHYDGGSDEIDITQVGGFTGNPAHVLRGDGTFGPALGAGGGQWIHLTSPTEPAQLITLGDGHPALIWWEGP